LYQSNLGVVFRRLGRLDVATDHFHKAHAAVLANGLEGSVRCAYLYNNWALTEEARGELTKASFHLRQSLEIFRRLPVSRADIVGIVGGNLVRVLTLLRDQHELDQLAPLQFRATAPTPLLAMPLAA
jgi:tetratricopeptide (TPR) repeat protein